MAEHTVQNNQSGPLIFDRHTLARRRARALPALGAHDVLHAHVAAELSDRMAAIKRDFHTGVELGARSGCFARSPAARKLDRLYGIDLVGPSAGRVHTGFAIGDEERLPLAKASVDLVVAPLSLHVMNDLPGVLLQIRRALKPDGLFLGTLFGGETLAELRTVLMEAEIEITGGASPHIAPAVDIRDAGALLQRAGLALSVADRDVLTVRYQTPFELMADLRGMGETNVLAERDRKFMRRDVLMRAMELYKDRFADPDGRIPAHFEIIYLSGWAPHESQQKPLRPGSAKARLADALDTKEFPVGDGPD